MALISDNSVTTVSLAVPTGDGGYDATTLAKETVMGIAILLVVLAVIVGAVGLLVSALKWLLIIAAVVFVAGLIAGWARRTTSV